MFKFKGTVREWQGHQAAQAQSIENVMSQEVSRFILLQKYAIKRDKTWAEYDRIWDKIAPRVR
jgi:hypothetical protein